MSRTQTYTLAHTARCKLQLAADRPDRDLRFILGHAFTLDNLRLRIAEIETDTSATISDSDSDEDLSTCNAIVGHVEKPRKVSFQGGSPRPQTVGPRPKSPPPDVLAQLSSSESEEEDDIEEDDEFEEELSLQRFESATAKAPRLIEDEDDGNEEDDVGPKSPEWGPSEGDLKIITGQEGDQELEEAYRRVSGCPCHGKQGPEVEKVWDIPGQKGVNGGRMAVVQIAA